MKSKGILVALTLLGGVLLIGLAAGCYPVEEEYRDYQETRLFWSPDGRHIILARDFTGIFVIDEAGTRLRTVDGGWATGGSLSSASFGATLSPNGSRIAYVEELRSNDLAIVTVALDGTDKRRLTPIGAKESLNSNPVWSPDGLQIAFTSDARLMVMDADGSNLRMLAPSVGLEERPAGRGQPPAWSPDGSRIAFVGAAADYDEGYEFTLYTVQPDGEELVAIGKLALNWAWWWSPDGSRLALLAAEIGEAGERGEVLYTVQPDGSDLARIGEGFVQPAWSPNGAWLAFVQKSAEESSVYIARHDGSDVRQVARGYGGPISWSLDGTELFIEGLAYAVRSDGSGLRQLVPGGIGGLFAWSPDASRLAVFTGISDDFQQEVVFTLSRDATEKRVLVRGNHSGLVAEHSDWRDVSRASEACAQGPAVPYPDTNSALVPDCETLLMLRDKLAGDAFLNWSVAVPITAWQGVHLEGSPGNPSRVTGLLLDDVGLTGTIPPELGNLTGLQRLDLSNNDLRGDVPPELGDLFALQVLYLHGNSLTGCVPAVLSDHLRVMEADGLEYCE